MDSNELAAPLSGKSDNTSVPPSKGFGGVIARNATLLTGALLVQKVLTFGYFVFINRSIQPEALGSYFQALTVATVFGYFVDIAFSQVVIRETAKHPEKTGTYLNASFSLKLLLAIFLYAGAILYVLLFHYPALTRSLVYLTAMTMILDSFTLTFYGVFRGHQQLQYEAFGTVVNVIIKVLIGVVGIKLGYGVHVIILAILVASAFNTLFSGTLLIRKLKWKPKVLWDGETLKFLSKIAIPFAIAGVFQTVYTNQDQLLLANPVLVGAKGQSFTAWYGTAYKYAFALVFIPSAIAAAVFPAMSAFYLTNKEKLAQTFERAFGYLILVGMPVSFGIFVLAQNIIFAASSKVFAASVSPLQWLSISLFFLFLNYPVGYLLNATDRQTRNTVHIGIVMVVNLVLNSLFIPIYSFRGPAIASVISSVLLLGLGLAVVPKIIAVQWHALAQTAAKALLAAGSMAVLLWQLRDHMPLYDLFGIGIVWYAVALFIVRGYSLDDGKRVFRTVRAKLG